MQGPAGLESVRVGGDPAHRMERDRPPDHRLVPAAVDVGPRNVEGDGPFEGGLRDLGRKPPDGAGSPPRSPPRPRPARSRGRGRGGRGARTRDARPARPAARTGPGGRDGSPGRRRGEARSATRSQTSGRPSPSRAKSPSSGSPGASSTSHGAFVYEARYAASTRPERSSSCASARTSSPSVPGVIPIHSSAIAE